MDRRPETDADLPSKCARVGENIDNAKKKWNEKDEKAAEDSKPIMNLKEASPASQEKKEEPSTKEDATDEVKCAICFEPATEEFQVFPHDCSACRAACWSACEACNEALLSRACPFCKSDYAPKILYELPGRALSSVMEPSMAPLDKILTTIKIKFLTERVFPLANALCILPEGIAQFSLSKAGESDEVIIVRTKVQGSEIEKGLKNDCGEFRFVNKCWDLIEKVSEEADSEDNTAETLDSKAGSTKMIKACLAKGAKLYTPISTASWEELEEEWKAEF